MQSFLVEAVRTETYTRTQTEISLAASSFFQALHQADSQGEFPARLARKSPCASLMSSRSYHFRSIDFSSVSLIKMAEQIVPPVEGYPKLACHMGRYAQSAIFRRFGGLNSQNILYMQAELTHLEKRLQKGQGEDAVFAEGNRSKYSRDWYWLKNYAAEENSKQWETVLAIRQKLKDYSSLPTEDQVK